MFIPMSPVVIYDGLVAYLAWNTHGQFDCCLLRKHKVAGVTPERALLGLYNVVQSDDAQLVDKPQGFRPESPNWKSINTSFLPSMILSCYAGAK